MEGEPLKPNVRVLVEGVTVETVGAVVPVAVVNTIVQVPMKPEPDIDQPLVPIVMGQFVMVAVVVPVQAAFVKPVVAVITTGGAKET